MNNIIIVRAGSTAWQEDDRLQGTVPLPVTGAGQEVLHKIAQLLVQAHPDSLYSSGNESSGASADFLAKHCKLKARKIAQFKEVNCGLWQGMRIKDIQNRFNSAYKKWRKDPTSITPCQGESLGQVETRVREGLDLIRKKNTGKTVIVVAAHLVSAVIDCILTETSLDQMWHFADKQTSIRNYKVDEAGEVSVVEYNGGLEMIPAAVAE
jgi:broad specificity phosphatase PhoE